MKVKQDKKWPEAQERGRRRIKSCSLEMNAYAFQFTAALAPDINQRKKERDAGRKCKQLGKFHPPLNMSLHIFRNEYVC
jgi:hypothetical protein